MFNTVRAGQRQQLDALPGIRKGHLHVLTNFVSSALNGFAATVRLVSALAVPWQRRALHLAVPKRSDEQLTRCNFPLPSPYYLLTDRDDMIVCLEY